MSATPFLVGVAGGSGSGKTTVVQELAARLHPRRVGVIHHDSYYRDLGHLPPGERDLVNFDHPEALETNLLVRHLEALRGGAPVEVPIYDFTTHERRKETRRVEPPEVLIVDGILVLSDERLRRLLDLRIYVHTEADLRLVRRLRRDTGERGRSLESVMAQYLETVRPMHQEHVEPTRRHADVTVTEGGWNHAAIEALASRVKRALTDPATGS